MEKPSLIQTGVDRLVDLVTTQHRISFQDAAKELGVSKAVVEEWANFLEEEGVISIEYSFTTPFLTEKKLTKKEIQGKAKEFHDKKDSFVRKAESSLYSIEASTQGLDKMREQFDKLKGELSTEIEAVRAELEELKNYERLKKGIDDLMLQQRHEFQTKIDEVNNQLLAEQKKYQDLVSQIEDEGVKLEKERVEAVTIEEQEAKMEQGLQQLTKLLQTIYDRAKDQKHSMALDEKRIDQLKQLSKKIEQEINQKKGVIPGLVEQSKKQEVKIMETQKKVLDKITARHAAMGSSISKGEEVYNRFKGFFEHKRDIETLLAKITQDKTVLEQELQGLVKKAMVFEAAAKSGDLHKHVAEMNAKLEDIEKKKSFLQRELEHLASLMGGEDKTEDLKKVEDYVQKAFKQNKNEDEIRKSLNANGWSKDLIDRALKKKEK
ncbi:MAG: hypothetical protein V1735_07815 [Nanoarchaeota archaeon]